MDSSHDVKDDILSPGTASPQRSLQDSSTSMRLPDALPSFNEEWLSEVAADRLLACGVLEVPWELALLLREIGEDEDRVQELSGHLPDWLVEEDIEVLIDSLLDASLPPLTELKLQLRARGTAGRKGYRLEARWIDEEGLPIDPLPLQDAVFIEEPSTSDAPHTSTIRRLSYGQWMLQQSLPHLPALGLSRTDDLLATDLLRSVIPSGDPGVVLDRFLQREEVVQAHRVEPFFEKLEGGDYRLTPRVEGIPEDSLKRYFHAQNAEHLGEQVLALRDGDKRRRVVFSPRAKAALQDLRKLGRLSPTQAAAAISNPETFFGTNIDTSQLTERVIGFGPDIRMPTPRLQETPSSDWFGAPISLDLEGYEDEQSSSDPLDLTNPDVRVWLRQAIDEATARGEHYIALPGQHALIELSRALIDALEAAEAIAARPPANVLQVHDNLLEVAFEVEAPVIKTPTHREPLPPGLREGVKLFDHQREGYEWLLQRSGILDSVEPVEHGALLADDMGLGKTLQVLAFISRSIAEGRKGPYLVVAPIALLMNWEQEAHRFFGKRFEPIFRVNPRKIPSDPVQLTRILKTQRLVLVSYETLRRREISFAQVDWHTVILDEAQKAKNSDTQIARVIRAIPARFRLAMTGTPVENGLSELWTLIDWITPGLLGSLREFSQNYIQPLLNDYDTQRAKLAEQLHEKIRPVFLRRTKEGVLSDQLPTIRTEQHFIPLGDLQISLMQDVIQRARKRPGKGLAALSRLFGLCAHPAILEKAPTLPDLTDLSFPKGEALMALLDQIALRKEKALIFANRRCVQRWIARQIRLRYDIATAIINGAVTGSERRMQIVQRFSESKDFNVLVLAPRAAGMGLNITAANHVIHYMREWNPAVEKQATDRAYRIGQTRPVTVHQLIGTWEERRTVEEVLDTLLAKKRQLMTDFVVAMGSPALELSDIWGVVQKEIK